MDKITLLIKWANLPLQKQIVITLAAFIIMNSSIVLFFLNRETVKEVEYNAVIKFKDKKIDQLQDEKAACWQYHLRYVDKKETEYQNILIELKKFNKP